MKKSMLSNRNSIGVANSLIFGILLTISLTRPAKASTYTYTYQGGEYYTHCLGTYQGSGGPGNCNGYYQLTGWFTVSSPVGPNHSSNFQIPFLSASLSDGFGVTLSYNAPSPNVTSSVLRISTDSNGNIDGWDFSLSNIIFDPPGPGPYTGMLTETFSGGAEDITGVTGVDEHHHAYNEGHGQTDVYQGGTWTLEIPEPSALLLVGTALLGLGGLVKRKS